MTDSMLLQDCHDVHDERAHAPYQAPQLGRLSKAQGMLLLTRLIEDQAFRARFERAPGAALQELGVPALQIGTLRTACLMPRTLASGAELARARQRLKEDLDQSALVMAPPNLKLS